MKLIQEFIIVVIILFSINMIYFYFRNKSKKYSKIPTVEMELIMRMFKMDISSIGIKKVQTDISIINSIIMTIDLLILYHIKSIIIAIIIIVITTFILIGILYYILGNSYRNLMFRR